MICIICRSAPKYKCPNCHAPYCSVECFKTHKEIPCKAPTPPPEIKNESINKKEFDYPTEDTVAIEKLKLLETSADVRNCLENPHVRQILDQLDKSPYPDQLIQDYMQEPIFTEFVDACLQVVEPQANDTGAIASSMVV